MNIKFEITSMDFSKHPDIPQELEVAHITLPDLNAELWYLFGELYQVNRGKTSYLCPLDQAWFTLDNYDPNDPLNEDEVNSILAYAEKINLSYDIDNGEATPIYRYTLSLNS